MKATKELKSAYYLYLITSIIFSIMIVLGMILLMVNNPVFFELEESTSIFIKYVLIVILSITECWFVYKLIICLKDFSTVKNNNFKTTIGTVYRYAKNEAETGQQLNSHPIIKLLNSEETIELFINKGTELNKTYKFIYLEHTKIGAVEEEYFG
jgi:hypothetical protein